jgi:hypothetical protein
MSQTLEESSLTFYKAINNKRGRIKDTHQRENKKKVKRERGVFYLQFSTVWVFHILFVYFQVSLGYETLMNCVILIVKRETSPKILKNS